MRKNLMSVLAAVALVALGGTLHAQCQNGRCPTGQCFPAPSGAAWGQPFGTSWVTAPPAIAAVADAADVSAWGRMTADERVRYNAACDRVAAGHEVYVSTGAYITRPYVELVYCPSGVPGLEANAVYRCYRGEDGRPKAQKVPPAELHAGPQTLTGEEKRFPLTVVDKLKPSSPAK